MRSLQRLSQLFWLANAAFFLMSVSALLMPLTEVVGGIGGRIITVLIGLMFWLSLLAGGALVYLAERLRKTIASRHPTGNARWGVITFFDNPLASICDTVLIAGAGAFVVINLSNLKYQYVSYIFLFLLMLSLSMHCMFNGRIYKTIKQGLEGEKNNG